MTSFVIIMLAPNPNKFFVATSGNAYLSSTLGLIVNVAATDVASLGQQGCALLVPRNNLVATRAPLNTDDFTAGYGVGSLWTNLDNVGGPAVYVCTSMGTSPGNAAWTAVLAGEGGITTYNPQIITSTSTPIDLSATYNFFSIRQATPTAATFNLPSGPAAGYYATVKDSAGVTSLNNFTIATLDSTTIDGKSTFTFNNNFQEQQFVFDGLEWCVGG